MNNLSLNCDCDTSQNILYKGTTPIFNFTVSLDISLLILEQTHIIFASGRGVVDKTNTDIMTSNNLMSCSLTQEDTLSFTGTQVNIQILCTLNNGQKVASNIMCIPISDTLMEGIGW